MEVVAPEMLNQHPKYSSKWLTKQSAYKKVYVTDILQGTAFSISRPIPGKFLGEYVTIDTTCIHCYTPETKE